MQRRIRWWTTILLAGFLATMAGVYSAEITNLKWKWLKTRMGPSFEFTADDGAAFVRAA